MQRMTDELQDRLKEQLTLKMSCESCKEWHITASELQRVWYAQFVIKECPLCHPEKKYVYADDPWFWD